MPHPRAAALLAALLAACIGTGRSLEVSFAADHRSYELTHGAAKTTLFSAKGGIAAFVDGRWHTQAEGTLKPVGAAKAVKGEHPVLGAFTGTELQFVAGATPMTATAKNYAGNTVTFEYTFPKGALGTSLVALANRTRDEVVVNFPAFTNQSLQGTMSWQGSFVGAVQGGVSKGPMGGPTVFFDPDDAELKTVVIGSALDNFKSTSAGPGTTYDGKTKAWAPGTPGTITSLPAGFTQTFVLRAGSGPGITAAIAEWGGLLQAYHRSYKVADVTLSKIGYQTDNGAYYVFCETANCSKTLLDAVADLKQLGVPMGYLSFQGAGASSVNVAGAAPLRRLDEGPSPPPSAPWCVNTWGPDLHGEERRKFPVELAGGAFAEALGIPLQLYAPYFCPESKYFSRVDPSSNWTSVVSDTSIDGCSFYGFQDVEPSQSLEVRILRHFREI